MEVKADKPLNTELKCEVQLHSDISDKVEMNQQTEPVSVGLGWHYW